MVYEIFEKAMRQTLGHEGGYSNDPDDAGEETIFGISRRFHPDWLGWGFVDGAKNIDDNDIIDLSNISKCSPIHGFVDDFYRINFWNRFQGGLIARISGDVACEIFDTAVNMGVHRGVIFLQKSLNFLNRNQVIFPDLAEDGLMGPASLRALEQIDGLCDTPALLKIMNVLQGQHYLDYMKQNPVQEKYARGWFNRVSL